MSATEDSSYYFVGRKDDIKTFTDFTSQIDENVSDTEVLHFYGVGGVGKTSLRKEFTRYLSGQEGSLYSLLDFRYPEHRDQKEALSHLGVLLQEQCPGLEFNSFIFAYEVYWNKINSHKISHHRESVPVGDSADYILTNFIKDVSEINWLNSVPKGIQILQKYTKITKEWLARRGNKIYKHIEQLDANEVEEILCTYWAEDLNKYLEEKEPRTLVIFLDTLEALKEFNRNSPKYVDPEEWVIKLISHLPQVRWVTFGREKVEWNQHVSSDRMRISTYPLDNMNFEDAKELMEHHKIVDGDVHKVIFTTTKGLPLFLNLAIITYKNIKQKRIPTAIDFEGDRDKIIERFLLYLTDQQKETLHILSVPKIWTSDLFKILVEKFNKIGNSEAKRLLQYSFITYNEEFATYEMHDQMREILQESLRNEDSSLFQKIYRVLYEYYVEKVRENFPKNITKKEQLFMQEAYEYGSYIEPIHSIGEWVVEIADHLYYTKDSLSEELEHFLLEVYEELDADTDKHECLLKINLLSSLNFLFLKQREVHKIKKHLDQHLDLIKIGKNQYQFSSREVREGEYYAIKATLHLINAETKETLNCITESEKYKEHSYKSCFTLADIYESAGFEIKAMGVLIDLMDALDEHFFDDHSKYMDSLYEASSGMNVKKLQKIMSIESNLQEYEKMNTQYNTFSLIRAHLHSKLINLMNEKQPEFAFTLFETTINTFTKFLGEDSEITIAEMNKLGMNYLYRKEYPLAIEQFEKVLKLSNYSLLTAESYINISYTFEKQGNKTKVKEYLEKALEVVQEASLSIKGHILLSDIQHFIGIWYANQKKFPRSIRWLRESIQSYPPHIKYQRIDVYNTLITSYLGQKKYEEAEKWALEGLDIAKIYLNKNEKERIELAFLYTKVVDNLYTFPRREKVYIDILKEYFSTEEQMDSKEYPSLVLGLANIKLELEKYPEAEELIKNLLKNVNLTQRLKANAHYLLGCTFNYQDNKKGAEREFDKTLQVIQGLNNTKDQLTNGMLSQILLYYKDEPKKKYQKYLDKISKIDPSFKLSGF